MHGLRHFLIALQFFTRIPVTGRLAQWVGFSPRMLAASAVHFPGVGWVVGGLSAMVWWLAAWGWCGTGCGIGVSPSTAVVKAGVGAGAWLAAIAATAFGLWLTGAFHEDGLADTADALGGHVDRERALVIMKDSRIGSYGAAALVLALLTKSALLAVLAGQGAEAAMLGLVVAHVLSRSTPLWMLWRLPYVADLAGSKSKPLAEAIDVAGLLRAFLWVGPALALLGWAWGMPRLLAVVAALALVLLYLHRLLRRRLGGFTGDTLGATQQLSELAVYAVLAASVRAA